VEEECVDDKKTDEDLPCLWERRNVTKKDYLQEEGKKRHDARLNHPKEIAITLKDDERRMTHKFLIYEPFVADPQDETVERCIKEAMESFKGSPDVVKVKISFEC